jgi:hypothetical protein
MLFCLECGNQRRWIKGGANGKIPILGLKIPGKWLETTLFNTLMDILSIFIKAVYTASKTACGQWGKDQY